MLYTVRFSNVSTIKKQRAVLTISKNNEHGERVVQRTKRQLVAKGFTVQMATGHLAFPSTSIRYILLRPVCYKSLQRGVNVSFLGRGPDRPGTTCGDGVLERVYQRDPSAFSSCSQRGVPRMAWWKIGWIPVSIPTQPPIRSPYWCVFLFITITRSHTVLFQEEATYH